LLSTTGSESRRTADTGAAATPATKPAGIIEWVIATPTDEQPVPDGFVEIDDLIDAKEKTSAGRAALSAARTRLAARLPEAGRGLSALRLRKGLSQKQLAQAIGTSQPHIARIERGRDNVLLATAVHLAQALEVNLIEVTEALGYGQRRA